MIVTAATPCILNALLGTRCKAITGYKGAGDARWAWSVASCTAWTIGFGQT